jgi:hypothetical protein
VLRIEVQLGDADDLLIELLPGLGGQLIEIRAHAAELSLE